MVHGPNVVGRDILVSYLGRPTSLYSPQHIESFAQVRDALTGVEELGGAGEEPEYLRI